MYEVTSVMFDNPLLHGFSYKLEDVVPPNSHTTVQRNPQHVEI